MDSMVPQCHVCSLPLSSPSTLLCGHSQCTAHPSPCPECDAPPHGKLDVSLNNIITLSNAGKDFEHELTCHICFQIFLHPTTLASCQHSFCSHCIQRSLDHNPSCPVCRSPVPPIYFNDPPLNRALQAIILNAYSSPYNARLSALQHDLRLASLSTPIFVCQLSFPGLPTILHFFEPRYRLMLRRCLQSPSPSFGMVMSPKQGSPQADYGTMLDIKSVQFLPDGRSVVQTFGSSRFRILERGSLDGYMVARIESISDIPDDIPQPLLPSIQDLIDTCKTFITRIQQGTAPWVVQRISSTYGSMPSDPTLFCFWTALVLPIEEQEKAKLLPIKSPRLRLIMVVSWIERLNKNWFSLVFLFHQHVPAQIFKPKKIGGSRTAVPSLEIKQDGRSIATSPKLVVNYLEQRLDALMVGAAGSDAAMPDTVIDTVVDTKNKSSLTPIRAHYLKKSLLQLQFAHELQLITSQAPPHVSTLSYLGPPLLPLPEDVLPADIPLLKYIFRQYFLTFPFMAAAPKDFYSQKLQPFVAVLIARGLTPTSALDDDVDEGALQKKIVQRLERNLSLFLGSAIKLVEPEEVVRLTQTDLNRLEALTAQRERRRAKAKEYFDVNVVGVRTIIEKGRMRNRAHDEFIIRTRRSRYPDVYVSRRHGDFQTLYHELTKAHAQEDIRCPPGKDRTHVKTPVASPISSDSFSLGSSSSLPHDTSRPSTLGNPNLTREKNRLTLRSYLHSLLSSSTLASSPVLRSFLLSGAISLSDDDLEDIKRREEVDRLREEGRKNFASEIAGRIDHLREAVKSVRVELLGKDGLRSFFSTIKQTSDIQSLPETYHSVVEWARFSLASAVYRTYVASDDASETFGGLKRIHGQMPYFMLKAALKITNPVTMLRNVMDLFLATPFGGKSLLQRMFTSSLSEETKLLEDEIQALVNKINDPIMCAKIRQFVYASREVQIRSKEGARIEEMDVIIFVLRSSDAPVLTRRQLTRLSRAYTAYEACMAPKVEHSSEEIGPEDEDCWLIEDLKVLAHLYSKLKDREQLISLIFEGFTSDLLKDILTIFYSPLAKVYRAANIADSLSDLQNFLSDLIRTVEAVELFDPQDTHTIVRTFVELIQRHEHSFYTFIHKVHSKGEGLFTDLMQWIELFLTVLREGLGEGLSLEFLLPHNGEEREKFISEIDKVVLYHYKLKILYEEKLRRRFGRVQGRSTNEDAENEATQALLDSITGELNFGELASGDALDLAAQETDEDSSSDEYSTTEESNAESGSQNSVSGEVFPKSQSAPQVFRVTQPPSRVSQSRAASIERNSATNAVVRPKRSLSLRSVRSFVSLGKNQELPPPPPVPPLPISVKSSMSASKKTSQSQTSLHHESTSNGIRSQGWIQPHPPIQNHVRDSKNIRQTLSPPDLHLIPQLLPIFIELLRPSLRVRKSNQ